MKSGCEIGRKVRCLKYFSRFIDANGKIVDENLNTGTIRMPLNERWARELSIGVAAGQAKHKITLACLRAGYINVLVTDEQTALFLLSDEAHHD